MHHGYDPPALALHEWGAVFLVLMAFVLLGVLVGWEALPSLDRDKPRFVFDHQVEVLVQGAVEQPGRFVVQKGTTVQEVLAQAKTLPEADLRHIKGHAKVRRNQMIKVPKQLLITVTVEGAVEHPGSLILPKGACLEDLIEKLTFSSDAHVEALRKKRRLKDGEKIIVKSLDH